MQCLRAGQQAKSALEEAEAYEHHHLVARALGNADASVSPTAAQAALDKVEVNHAAATKTVEALKAEHEQAE